MSDSTGPRVTRRDLLRGGAGATATAGGLAAATGSAAAQESGGSGGGPTTQPDFGGYLSNVDGGFKDARGQKQVTVDVGAKGNSGNYAFNPARLWVDPGTTVTWKWTGKGGGHSVTAESGDFDSGVHADGGYTFKQTFSDSGLVEYYCEPHKSLGMKGGVGVGDSIKTKQVGGTYQSVLPNSAKTLGVATVGALLSVLGLAYVFLRYGGDYGDDVE